MFHWQDGWFFARKPDGSVLIQKTETAQLDAKVVLDATIDSHSWASIVASVSKLGEADGRFYKALEFHGEEKKS